jgi:hypothetical protein
MGALNGAMSNKKIYAGIGSRKTPPETLVIIKKLAGLLERKDWLLRSGGADGADTAFEQVVMDARHRAIFLPGDWFNERKAGPGGFYDSTRLPGWQEALETVDRFHPASNNLSPFARKLMARNAMQILGPKLNHPADLVITWTEMGLRKGGTGQALRIAEEHGVPIVNLGSQFYSNLIQGVRSGINAEYVVIQKVMERCWQLEQKP